MKAKWRSGTSLLLLSVFLLTACSEQPSTSQQDPHIQSGTVNTSYQGIEHPSVPTKLKINDNQKKAFDQKQQQESQQNGGNDSGKKPTV